MNILRTNLSRVAVVVTSGLLAIPAQGAAPKDPYGPRGSWTAILKTKAARMSLKLSPAQFESVDNLSPAKGDHRDRIAKFLKPEQVHKLQRISWRAQGGYALFDPALSKPLAVTAGQQTRLAAADKVNQAEHRKMKSFLSRARFRSRAAMRKYISGYRNAADRRLSDVLTKKQKKRLRTILEDAIAK